MQEASPEKTAAAMAVIRDAMARIEALTESISRGQAGVTLRDMAERLYSDRRMRDQYFPAGLFGEPAWDLLLALFAARDEGRDMDLAQASEAAQVDAAAGPELIAKLQEQGLVLRKAAAGGSRRETVELTDHAVERLSDYLANLI